MPDLVCPAVPAGPGLKSTSTQNGTHRLFPQHSSLEVVEIDRGGYLSHGEVAEVSIDGLGAILNCIIIQ